MVPVESTDATVTYDYGNHKDPSWKTSDTVAKGEKVTPSISTMAEYSDWTGYYILDGWYKDDETTTFDFENTPITENITLHAKWEKEYTKEFANIESSETKSQLYYEYKTIALETTLISFGDNTFSGTTVFKKESFIDSQSGKDLGVTELSNNSSKCYYQSGSALSVGSTSYAGEFTITFPKIIVKEVNVYAKLFNKNQNYDNFKVSTSANPTGDSKPIEGYTDYAKYSYTGLDNGNDDPSTTITFGSYSNIKNKKIAIQKIEIITADTNAAEPTLYTVSNMGLRFGGAIAKDHYEAETQNETDKTVKDHVKSVGMIWTTALPETTDGKAYGSLTAAIEAGAITETNAHIKTMDVAEKELVLDGDYYRYNCSISVSEASINTVIYAVATMTFDNGLTIYLEETSNSVITIAKKYVEDTTTYNTYSEPIQKTLKALSEGKTSVAIA